MIHDIAIGNAVTQQERDFAERALRGRGYQSPTASALYHLRNTKLLVNNCLAANSPQFGGFFPDSIIIHFYNRERVRKNLKEISYHSLLNYQPQYRAFKNLINIAHQNQLNQVPESSPIVSSSHLQRH